MNTQPRRQLLIDTAFDLFNEHGFHATGIDRILKESGVSKATLYKYFTSKDELILAVLEQRHNALIDTVSEFFSSAPQQAESVLIVFDIYDEWFNSSYFFGCNFINAGAEYSDDNSKIHHYSTFHKESLRQKLEDFLVHIAIPTEQSATIANSMLLLLDGAIIGAQIRDDKQSAIKAKVIAKKLLSDIS